MKILQYNILYGAKTKNRLTPFSTWMQKQQYDVAGFNELNDWNEDEFQREAEKWGYPHSCLFEMTSSPFFIGIVSKTPIEQIDRTEAHPFYHALLHVKIRGVHFFVTHLTSFESVNREQETAKIAKLVSAIGEPVVVMGDFNTLSPLDHAYYKETDASTRLASNVRDGKINYRPMNHLLDAGLFDAGHHPTIDYSFPTTLEHDPRRAIRRRIDYVLVNDALRRRNPVANVIRNDEVEALSDHYPIQCVWEDPDAE